MTNTLSFMSANFVAREVGYHMTEGWMQGDTASNDYFRPIDTFPQRFESLVQEIQTMDFEAMDVWTGHLHPNWATPAHIDAARRVLEAANMTVVSLAGYFGDTADEVEAACRLANALGTDVLGGNTGLLDTDRPALVALLREHNVRLGIENHPEKSPLELLTKIGDSGDEFIGAAVDTGWFGTQGYHAARALEALDGHLVHVHLKDILPPDPTLEPGVTMRSIGHETCAFGKGIVPLKACISVLKQQGYTGALSIEHEPEDFDPTEDVTASLALLKKWLSS